MDIFWKKVLENLYYGVKVCDWGYGFRLCEKVKWKWGVDKIWVKCGGNEFFEVGVWIIF